MKLRSGLWVLLGLLTGASAWASTEPYTFPFDDPYVATVIGTPRDVAAEPKPLHEAGAERGEPDDAAVG